MLDDALHSLSFCLQLKIRGREFTPLAVTTRKYRSTLYEIFHLIRSDNFGVDVLLRINDIDKSFTRYFRLMSTELGLTTLNLDYFISGSLRKQISDMMKGPQSYLACQQ